MDDKNSSNVQHPLHAALMIFHGTVRTAFETAAAFWRPWFREPEKKYVAARQHSKAASEEAPHPTKREQEATEKKPKAATKRAQRPKILTQEATMRKKLKAATKRSLKDEQELEREDRAQKTDRLRKLRLAKEAADREKNPSSNGRDEARRAIKE
jgi:type IV secretory pathway VirB10-like protein